MKTKDRMYLIRQGNELFNDGKVALSQKYFMKANYQDGILRVANHFFYEEKLPLLALPLYMKCGCKEKVDEIYKRMAFALGRMLDKDKPEDSTTTGDSESPKIGIAESSKVEIEITKAIKYETFDNIDTPETEN